MTKAIKKIAIVVMAMTMLLGAFAALTACVEEDREMKEFLSHFDLNDPKENWVDNGLEFELDRVNVILKRTNTVTFPKLEIWHFGLSSGHELEYRTQNEEDFANPLFRVIVTIYLREHGEEQVLDAVEQLSKLDFVKHVTPDIIFAVRDGI